MKHHLSTLLLCCLTALVVASCGTAKNFVLLNDIESPGQYTAPAGHELKVKNGDNLQIVISHHDPTVVRQFHQTVSADNNAKGNDQSNIYTVNSAGYVNLPIFDTVQVKGLTCNQISDMLSERLENEGVAYGAIVTVRIKSYKVTVIGETGTGVYEFEDNANTIFDLIAKANIAGASGGVTRRDKILVMRETDSLWMTDNISLLSTDLIYSPYFFLEQNDVFYVYPTKATILKTNTTFDFWWSRLSLVTSIVSLASTFLLYNKLK